MEVVAKLTGIFDESSRVKRFVFSCSLDFVPGQWVSVWSDEYEGRRRAYSIASDPGEPLELCVAKGENLSAFMHASKIGDEFHIQGPFGQFRLHDNKNVFFVAAGTGLAPFVPMINQALAEGRDVVLIYSARSEDEIIMRRWLDSIKGRAKVIITLTREEKPVFECGRIPTILPKYFQKGFDYYLCGYSDFLRCVESELKNLGAESIFYDNWG